MTIPDVVVAGAGPAGAATAIHLARRGRRVTLIDRFVEPRRKACGEGVFASGVRELEALGADMAVLGGRPLASVRFNAGRHSVEADLPGPGALGVHRGRLSAELLRLASSAGVNVVTGVSVLGLKLENRRVAGIRTTASQFEARVFVAADGLQSRLRRQAGLDARDPSDRYGVSAHARLPSPPARTIDVHFQRNREVYITPLDGSSANIALLLRKGEMAGVEGDLVRWFQRQLQAIPALEGYELEDVPLVAGPFGRSVKRAWRGNLVFTGDAAGFLDGISGDGISAGLLGARACAEAIDSYLSSGDFDAFRAYDRARRDIVRNSNFLARVSLTLGRNERIAAIAVANLSRRPETFAKLIAINSRAAGFSSLRPRDVLVLAAGI